MTQHLTKQQLAQLSRVSRRLEDLNEAMCAAVEHGLSIELIRKSRHHREGGYWGDLMTSHVVKVAE